MIKRVLQFLGWTGMRHMWSFPFAGMAPRGDDLAPILVDREGVAYKPQRRVVLRAK